VESLVKPVLNSLLNNLSSLVMARKTLHEKPQLEEKFLEEETIIKYESYIHDNVRDTITKVLNDWIKSKGAEPKSVCLHTSDIYTNAALKAGFTILNVPADHTPFFSRIIKTDVEAMEEYGKIRIIEYKPTPDEQTLINSIYNLIKDTTGYTKMPIFYEDIHYIVEDVKIKTETQWWRGLHYNNKIYIDKRQLSSIEELLRTWVHEIAHDTSDGAPDETRAFEFEMSSLFARILTHLEVMK
jgi:hypothetical protein